MTLNSEGLERTWRFDIQHGPDGEANYAWVYNGKDLVATMRTHHAVSIVEAMNRRALPPVDGLEVVGRMEAAIENVRSGHFFADYDRALSDLNALSNGLASLKSMQARAKVAEEKLAEAKIHIEVLAHTGVDFGFGPYKPENEKIEAARTFLSTLEAKP